MNPVILASGMKALEKIDFKKTAMYVGGALLLIIMVLVVRKMIKKAKEDKKDEDYLQLVEDSIVVTDLSYSEIDYQSMAKALEQHFADTGLSGGWQGVNQKGIYEVMERMKTNADIEKLIAVYGKRPAKDISFAGPLFAGLVKEKEYTLNAAMSSLLTNGERKKVNEILKENGLTYKFS